MELISNILIAAGAFGMAVYCAILSRRLRRFTDLEHGVGGAIAVLVAQVDDLKRTLVSTQKVAEQSRGISEKNLARAEAATRRLELLLASMSDLENAAIKSKAAPNTEDIV